MGEIGGGLAFDKALRGQVGKNSYLSKAQLKSKEEVQDGKQSTIFRDLRAGLAQSTVTQ
jgi:hypothetical protein